MGGDAALLAQVLQHPDDDGARLIYADWLDERRDPRGQFIRLQIALARLPAAHPDRPDLVRQERQLTQQHLAAWSCGLIGIARRCTFRRGFVEAVSLPATAFIAHGEALFAAAPIRKVHLTQVGPTADRLAACRQLCRVKSLDLAANDLDVAMAVRMLRSPHLAGLEALGLSVNGLTDDVAGVLADGAWPALRALDLSHNHLRAPAHLAQLAALDRLDLSHNSITEHGLAELLQALAGRKITMRIQGNPFGDAGAAHWLRSPAFTSVVQAGEPIDLSDCDLGPASARALAAHTLRSRLTVLTLDGNALGDDGLTALATAEGWPRLRRLSLAANGITDAGASRLAGSTLFAQLEQLDLRQNQFSPGGIELLWTSDRRHPRLVLDLADNVPPPPVAIDADDDAPIQVNWPDD